MILNDSLRFNDFRTKQREMENERINTASENDSSDISESESLENLVNPTLISELIADLDHQAGNIDDWLLVNYDDLIRKNFIRPCPTKTTESIELNGDTTIDLFRYPIGKFKYILVTTSVTDILISELKEQLEEEEFVNFEQEKKNNFLTEEIERLKVNLENEKSLKNDIQLQLKKMEHIKDSILMMQEIRLKDEQETMTEKLKKERETSNQYKNRFQKESEDKNEINRLLDEARDNMARLEDQLQQQEIRLKDERQAMTKQLKEERETTDYWFQTSNQHKSRFQKELEDKNEIMRLLDEARDDMARLEDQLQQLHDKNAVNIQHLDKYILINNQLILKKLNLESQLEEIHYEIFVKETGLNHKQEALNEIKQKFQEEQQTNDQLKNRFKKEIDEKNDIQSRLQVQVQHLQEDKVEDHKLIQDLKEKNRFLEHSVDSLTV